MGIEWLPFVEDNKKNEIEVQLALQCAPVITGVKVSNLFTVSEGIKAQVKELFRSSIYSILELISINGKVTYLIYHSKELERLIMTEEIAEFMNRKGYETTNLVKVLRIFKNKYQKCLLRNEEFPHEMGILLGYPIEDVKSFIENHGQNYLYAGYWKVYHNLLYALAEFDKYDKAREFIKGLIREEIDLKEILQICEQMQNVHELKTDTINSVLMFPKITFR